MLVVRSNIHADPMESSNGTLAIFDSQLLDFMDATSLRTKIQIQAGATMVRVQAFLMGHPIRISQTKEKNPLRFEEATIDFWLFA